VTNSYLCVYCWRVIPIENLFCELVSSPESTWLDPPKVAGTSKRIRVRDWRPLPQWRRWLGETPADPFESSDPNKPRLYCKCGEPISPVAKVRSDQSLAIRIAGAQNSGKTFFIATILDSLRQMRPVPIAAWGIGDTDTRFKEISDALLVQGQRLNTTRKQFGERYAWAIVEGEGMARSKPYPLLAVHDMAGEDWKNLGRDCPDAIKRYLGLHGDLILILDGATIADDLGLDPKDAWDEQPRPGDSGAMDLTILGHIRDLWGSRQIYKKVKLALVITKADLLWGRYPKEGDNVGAFVETHQQDQSMLENLLIDSKRGDLLVIANRFLDYRIFATSSLGFFPKQCDIINNKLRRKPRPSGTILPLLWLLGIELDGSSQETG
jgi:hypothetical protein